MVKVNCHLDGCQEEIELQPWRLKKTKRFFCCRTHQFEWQRSDEYKALQSHRKIRVMVNCSHCKSPIERKPSEVNEHYHFCNKLHRDAFMSENNNLYNPNPPKELIKVKCKHCEANFEVVESVYHKNVHGHFCKQECYWTWRSNHLIGENNPSYNRIQVQCDNEHCSRFFTITPYESDTRKHHFCREDCYWTFRSYFYVGENHPLFGTKKTDEQKNQQRLRVAKMYQEGIFDRKTSIQILIDDLLSNKQISFVNEANFGYYAIDNFLHQHGLAIEVMGDYWHSNPLVYDRLDALNHTQLDMVRRDKAKRTYLKNHHEIPVLYLWETDVNHNIELCEALIDYFIESNGNIPNVQSFNYYLDEGGKLKHKDTIILSYFE